MNWANLDAVYQQLNCMRIISFNANGIRSAASKDFFTWVTAQNADVLCVQETKAQREQLDESVFHPAGFYNYFRDASTKKGYSGVAIYSKQKPDCVITELGWPASVSYTHLRAHET
jgi:exodeoxyribonuclease-3